MHIIHHVCRGEGTEPCRNPCCHITSHAHTPAVHWSTTILQINGHGQLNLYEGMQTGSCCEGHRPWMHYTQHKWATTPVEITHQSVVLCSTAPSLDVSCMLTACDYDVTVNGMLAANNRTSPTVYWYYVHGPWVTYWLLSSFLSVALNLTSCKGKIYILRSSDNHYGRCFSGLTAIKRHKCHHLTYDKVPCTQIKQIHPHPLVLLSFVCAAALWNCISCSSQSSTCYVN